MPYRDTYGFPPYDPYKPGGGWDDETWQRYRQQQRERAYPGQFPNKTDRLARNKYRSDRKKQAAIAKIDATLQRNTLGERPPNAPNGGKSGEQIRYDRKVERRARLQAQRDRLQAELQRAPARPFSDEDKPAPAQATTIGTPTPASDKPVPVSKYKAPPNAYAGKAGTPPVNLPNNFTSTAAAAMSTTTTAGNRWDATPTAKANLERSRTAGTPGYTVKSTAQPATVPTAYAARTPGAPPPNLPTPSGGQGNKQGKGAPAQPAIVQKDWVSTAKAKGVDPYVIQQQKGQIAAQAKKVMGHTPKSGQGKDESAAARYTATQRAADANALKLIKQPPKAQKKVYKDKPAR